MRFLSAYATDVGPRSSQQDLAGATPTRLALADGMGGTRGGGEAAAAAIPAVLSAASLRQGFASAQAAVARVQQTPGLRDAGTTLVAVEVTPQGVQVMHSGDSRAYFAHEREVDLLTIDQSIAGQLLSMEHITVAQFLAGEGHQGLIGAIGGGEFAPESALVSATVGDIFILTSDGAHDNLHPHEMYRIVEDWRNFTQLGPPRVDHLAHALLDAARRKVLRDNATVLVGLLARA